MKNHPLKTFRRNTQRTQKQLAELVGVKRETIARWETRARTPSLAKAAKLSEITGISIDKFANAEDA